MPAQTYNKTLTDCLTYTHTYSHSTETDTHTAERQRENLMDNTKTIVTFQ